MYWKFVRGNLLGAGILILLWLLGIVIGDIWKAGWPARQDIFSLTVYGLILYLVIEAFGRLWSEKTGGKL